MPNIIIVGGGLAGLTAGLKLKDAGFQVRVLEAGAQAGGRVGSLRHNGAVVDTGAQIFGPQEPYTNTFALLERLGLRENLEQASNDASLVKKGKVHSYRYGSAGDFLKLPVLSLPSKLRLLGAVGELKRHAAVLDFHHLEKAESLDDQDVNQYVTELVGKDALDHLILPLMDVLYYYPPSGVSRAFFLGTISGLGDVGTYSLTGGNGDLPLRLAAQLEVTTGAVVREVRVGESGSITVDWEIKEGQGGEGQESAEADAVIMAAPADVAARVCTGLAAGEKEFLETVRYTSCIVAALGTDVPLGGRAYGVAIAPDESKLLVGVTFDHNKAADRAPAGGGLSMAFLNDASSRRLMEAEDKEILAPVLEELERLWPGHIKAAKWCHIFRHERATPLFEVGSIRRLSAFLDRKQRSPKIAFCGDYLCGPHMEGAVTSGIRAAEEITRLLG